MEIKFVDLKKNAKNIENNLKENEMMDQSVSEMLNNLQERVRRLRPTNPLEIGDDLP